MKVNIKFGQTGNRTKVTHNGEDIDGITKLEIVVLPDEVTVAKLWISFFNCSDLPLVLQGEYSEDEVGVLTKKLKLEDGRLKFEG